MKKISIDSFDVRKGHTLEEYRKFFAIPYDKGKLHSYTEDNISSMEIKRVYWEIIDKKGKKRYYAIPSRFKAFKSNNHSMPLYHNKRPFIIAMSIFGLCFVSCVSTYFIGRTINKTNFNGEIVEELDLKECSKDYHKWKEEGGKDPLGYFSIPRLANIAMAETIYKYDDETETVTPREKITTVGYGRTDTNFLGLHILVDISNAFIQNNNNVLEESISFCDKELPFVPKVGRRDFYYGENDKVISYNGRATSATTIDWDEEERGEMNKKDYIELVGKSPDLPFLYTITDKTVLTDQVYDEDPISGEKHFGNSLKKKLDNNQGYRIEMDIHNTLGVGKYVKRMTYLSEKTPDYFNTVHLVFETDNDLRLTYSEVSEQYSMVYMPTSGSMRTKYYYDNAAADIPTNPTSFDYSKYQF